MESPAVAVEDVSFTYGSGARTHALAGVDLQVEPGEFVSILGASGCGKSTLLRLVAGFMRPTQGRVMIRGSSPSAAARAHELGVVFQTPVLLPWRTVRANVELLLDAVGVARRSRRGIADKYLALVGLSEFGGSKPVELSGGMQQRVAIARALCYEPSILLMDEPFGALDALTRDRMGFELLRIWRSVGSTVLFVTHSVSEAILLSDRVVTLTPRPGRISSEYRIMFERPRSLDTRRQEEFVALETKLLAELEGDVRSEDDE